LEHIWDVDVLLIPVGGETVMDAKTAQRLIEAIEPRVVIPMYFMSGESKMNIQGPSEFLKVVGKSNLEPLDKFTVKGRAGLPEENMEFVLLEPQLKG
ncbi:MAG: MBL fold metallo-hydrolase, partial [Patescibacteria group bacterium]